MLYMIDIDGTICSHRTGKMTYHDVQPFVNRIKHFNSLFDSGHIIVYWTARGMSTGTDWFDLTRKQLDDWGVKYHELKMKKPSYDVWIDDKAVNADAYFKTL